MNSTKFDTLNDKLTSILDSEIEAEERVGVAHLVDYKVMYSIMHEPVGKLNGIAKKKGFYILRIEEPVSTIQKILYFIKRSSPSQEYMILHRDNLNIYSKTISAEKFKHLYGIHVDEDAEDLLLEFLESKVDYSLS